MTISTKVVAGDRMKQFVQNLFVALALALGQGRHVAWSSVPGQSILDLEVC